MLSKIRTAGKCTYSTICMYMCLSLIFVRALCAAPYGVRERIAGGSRSPSPDQ